MEGHNWCNLLITNKGFSQHLDIMPLQWYSTNQQAEAAADEWDWQSAETQQQTIYMLYGDYWHMSFRVIIDTWALRWLLTHELYGDYWHMSFTVIIDTWALGAI